MALAGKWCPGVRAGGRESGFCYQFFEGGKGYRNGDRGGQDPWDLLPSLGGGGVLGSSALPLTYCVTMDKSLPLSVPQFPPCKIFGAGTILFVQPLAP